MGINNSSSFKINGIKGAYQFFIHIINVEGIIWVGSLFYLIFINTPGKASFTLCPLKNLGFDFCPGCGLGNSISLIFRGEFSESFISHPLGLFVFIFLLIRIIKITKHNWSIYGKHITTNALP